MKLFMIVCLSLLVIANAKKDAFNANAKKDAVIENAKKDAAIENAKKDAVIENAKKDAVIENAKKDAAIENAKKDAAIENAKKDKMTEADQPAPPNPNSGSCIDQTPGLRILSGMKDFEKIFQHQSKMGQPGQCMGLWNGKQTCCDYNFLLNYAQKQIQSTTKLEKYVDNCDQYTEIRTLVGNYKAQIEEHEFLSFLHIFSMKEDFMDFILSNQQCSQHVIRSKNSALCTICLKDTKEFYRYGKALISSDSCSSMLQVCSTAISKTFEIIIGFNRLLRRLGNIEDDLHRHVAYAAQRTSEIISEKMAELGIVRLLRKYRLPLSVNSQTEEIQAKLCGSLFSLLKKPLTQQLEPVFEAYAELTKVIFSKKNVKKLEEILGTNINGNQINITASPRSLSRRLFTETTPDFMLIEPVPTSVSLDTSSSQLLLGSQSTISGLNNIDTTKLLQGDVAVMKKSDNMFSSYDGVKGSTLDSQYSYAKTIDLKLAFP